MAPTSGRLVPILIDEVTLPPYLNAIQAINARDLDTARVARELVALVGRRGALPEGDVRRLYFGQRPRLRAGAARRCGDHQRLDRPPAPDAPGPVAR